MKKRLRKKIQKKKDTAELDTHCLRIAFAAYEAEKGLQKLVAATKSLQSSL
jgi:hypothetical protein